MGDLPFPLRSSKVNSVCLCRAKDAVVSKAEGVTESERKNE